MGVYLKQFENHTMYENYINGIDAVLPNVSLCVQENDLHYNPYDPYNGHTYVDLGLPSGTKWATMNVGATSETDYGFYFQLGDTQGYTADQVGSDEGQKAFTWSDYKYGNGTNSPNASDMTKYNSTDSKTILDIEDDAVAVNWGGNWKMPTKTQLQELLDTTYVTSTWVIDHQGSGTNGRLFTSVTNGNTLFIPAAGYAENNGTPIVGNNGYIWINSLDGLDIKTCCCLSLSSKNVGISYVSRFSGQSVRGVVD